LTFVLLDSVAGNQLNYTDTSVYCYVIYDYKIEGIEMAGNLQNSFSDTALAKPVHFLPLPPPELWRTTVDTNLYTTTEWKMVNKIKFPIGYYTLYRMENTRWELEKNFITGTGLIYHNDLKKQVENQKYLLS